MRGKIDKLLINAFLSANEMPLKFNKNILTSECLDQKLHALRRFGERTLSCRIRRLPEELASDTDALQFALANTDRC